jgi:hypothetical protein
MAWSERPREHLIHVTSVPSLGADVARRVAERTRRERLEQDHIRALGDVRHRPEDSSPSIRRMLGYGDHPGVPQRWEPGVVWDGVEAKLGSVHVGPVNASDAPARRRTSG